MEEKNTKTKKTVKKETSSPKKPKTEKNVKEKKAQEEPAVVEEEKVVEEPTVVKEKVVEEPTVVEEEPKEVKKSNTLEMPKKKHNFPIIGLIIGIIVLVIIGIIGIIAISKARITEKQVVVQEMTGLFQTARKELNQAQKELLDYDLSKDKVGLTGTVTINSNYKDDDIDLTKLKKYKLSYNAQLNKKGNEASGQIELSKNDSIIDIAAYATENKVYVTLNDLFKKTISTTLDEEIKDMKFTEVTTKDFEKILKKTEEVTKEYVDDKDISKEQVTKKINNQEKKYTKITYKLDTNKYLKKIIESYRLDEEILEILANLTNEKKYEVENDLKDLEENLSDSDENIITINTYVTGFKSTVKEIEILKDEDNYLVIDYDNDKALIAVYVDKDKMLDGEYNSSTKSLKLKYDESGIKVNLECQAKNYQETTISILYQQDETTISADLVRHGTKKSNVQNDETKIDVSYKDSSDNIKFSITNKSQITKNAKVEKIDTDKSVDVDDLTDDELTDILEKLSAKIEDIISEIAPGYTDDVTDYSLF